MNDVDTYLRAVKPSQKKALEHIRSLVHQTVPDVEEMISYGMPTFKHKGRVLLHIAAFKDHMSVFPTADPSLSELGEELKKFKTSKGTLQFTEDNPIPDRLIKEIIHTRLASIS